MAFFGIRTNYAVFDCWFNLFPSLAKTEGVKGSNLLSLRFPGNFLPIHSKTHILVKKLLTFLSAMVLAVTLSANNTSISKVSLTGKNTGSQYILVQFDISWENSWRTSSAPNNWDAAWVFVKYRVGGGAWQHAWLNENGHTAPSGSTIDPGLLTPGASFNSSTNPGLGAFIYRNADGTGTFSKTGVQLRWNYGANGVADNAVVDIRVFAVEMVYVPQGTFTLGSGGTETGSLTNGPWSSGATLPLSIASENALTVANSAGNLWYTSTSTDIGDRAGPIPDAFPKGFHPFYCMKYEISQQQYVDFLNTLTQTQATARKYAKPVSNFRYEITGSAIGSYATTNPYVACNYLSWMDGATYTDWAGLRPMTELEFEKACRGTATPVANEYAWGNATATAAKNITNGGANNETTSTSGANAVFNDPPYDQAGPMRTGVFATGSTTRAQAGATYYGIMEMSGNLWEKTVTVGNATGRAYTGVHGNGALSAAGYADISTWPGYVTSEVTGATGSGLRGGSILDYWMGVSDRNLGAFDYSDRFNNGGFRAVRNLPPFTCGSTITISHLSSGGVAPVDKTVNYGTVTNIPGEITKCWITSNLGADHQATAVDDATEASSGWYWQFNRKQGYKHDGTNRTPNTTWINSINENSDWETSNDPCGLELGSGWRIPSYTEWFNVDASGSWTDWNGPWNSLLKIHAAGNLGYSDGSLISRGSVGYYWSRTQHDDINGWFLAFASGYCNMYDYYPKANGFTLRCIHDLLSTVTTTAVTSITATTASSGGNVTEDGGSAVTARGVCWSTSTSPTLIDNHTSDGTGTGTFTSSLTGLNQHTTYYVRAYATNSTGTAYGNQQSFVTLWAACFVAGTKITMADGSIKNIEDILVGDKVKSVDPETMETVARTVTRTLVNPPSDQLLRITFSNGIVNTSTKMHPYWVKGKGWSSVDPAPFKGKEGFSLVPLAVGDQCQVLESGKLAPLIITSIKMLPKLSVPTYNFSVEETNCYFANGILVHNK